MNAVENEQNSAVVKGRDQVKKIQLQRKELVGQKKAVEQELETGDPELLKLRAAQFAGGDSQEYDDLSLRLISLRDRLKSLDFDLRALELAEQDAWEDLRAAERQTRAQYREKKYRDAKQLTTEMKASLEKAVKLNGRLLELDEELKKSDVSDTGNKSLLMLLRYGASWNALSPIPIKGSALHISDWYAHIEQIFGK